ncbi:MAG: hypothetical protein JST70_17480 [Bacteroidetes bacterium]|nr:hypothetical protein [Bacteroidota bacterium]
MPNQHKSKRIDADKNESKRIDANAIKFDNSLGLDELTLSDKIDESNQLAMINELELNNADIVEELVKSKNLFEYPALLKFSQRIELALIAAKIGDEISRSDSPDYFDNYLNVRIPNQKDLVADAAHGPIPDFYVLPCNKDNTIRVADSRSEFIITPDNIYYLFYLALKLRLSPSEKLKSILTYQFATYFDRDVEEFVDRLQAMSIDYKEILDDRLPLLQKYLDMTANADTSDPDAGSHNLDEENDLNEDELNTDANNNHRQQVIAMYFLLEELFKNLDCDRPSKMDIARFIIFMTGKSSDKPIKDTNTYKFLRKRLVGDNHRNTKNLQIVRDFFEKLHLTNIAEEIAKEIKV